MLIKQLCTSLGVSKAVLARALSLSVKTLERYDLKYELPPSLTGSFISALVTKSKDPLARPVLSALIQRAAKDGEAEFMLNRLFDVLVMAERLNLK